MPALSSQTGKACKQMHLIYIKSVNPNLILITLMMALYCFS
uniref:Uncharacterized protein n=1 Tax=Siphoviridae sp. ctvBz3 TaxID=2825720 RepID=A0A8S5TXK3_9CAUD|nr:MAG TPA: hypothetical protein [Siphoviridae sp. ctvBz3]